MPTITQWNVEVDVDVDIDVDDFLDECSPGEIKYVLKWLRDNDYLADFLDECSPGEIKYVLKWLRDNDYLDGTFLLTGRESINEHEYLNALTKLRNNWLSLSREEEDVILNIAKRF